MFPSIPVNLENDRAPVLFNFSIVTMMCFMEVEMRGKVNGSCK